jgi:tRNA(Ile)-lysidine synthase
VRTRRPTDWPKAAAAVAERIPAGRLHPSVVAWAGNRPRPERWAVAFSGGADSLAVLLLVWAHWPARRPRLTVLHFDHRLRGAESTADARFCRRVCRSLGVTLVSGRWSSGRSTRREGAARAGRFAFIEREMSRRRLRVLWLGHQQDDVAETMMMRLARGSGTAGLAAPRAIHSFAEGKDYRGRVHVRPLLSLKKAEIVRNLRACGAAWREDSSNTEGIHFRNRLRRDVIPRWVRASERDALSGAALSRELLEEDDRALEAWVDALRPLNSDRSLSVARLGGKPRAVIRRALHRWLLLQARAGELSRKGFEALLDAVERGASTRHSLGSEGFATLRAGRLRFEKVSRKPRAP